MKSEESYPGRGYLLEETPEAIGSLLNSVKRCEEENDKKQGWGPTEGLVCHGEEVGVFLRIWRTREGL